MTQPGRAQPLSTLYTRAQRLLGFTTPGSIQMWSPVTVQPVQVVADVSDAAVPHQNPLFAMTAALAPQATLNHVIALHATRRLCRVWTVFVELGSSVRMMTLTEDIRTGGQVTLACASLGPVGVPLAATVGGNTARALTGTTIGPAAPFTVLNTFAPELVQWNTAGAKFTGMLLAPGSFLTFQNTQTNNNTTLSMIWEEIPAQDESSQLGFPAA